MWGRGLPNLRLPGLLDGRLTPDCVSEKLCEGPPGQGGERYAEKDKSCTTLSNPVLSKAV